MSATPLAEELARAVAIAEEAGRIVLAGYRNAPHVEKKGAIDLVTEFDLRSERHIRERLAEHFAGDAVVAEEGDAARAHEHHSGRVWYVDPLDGTTNYAHGHPFFCVSMALWEGDSGRLGVVHAPALGVTWAAARGQGATRNGAPCHVSKTTQLLEALCATGFPYDRATRRGDDNLGEYTAFLRRSQGVRRCGAAALDLSLIADGSYEIYWEKHLSAWDMCAGAVLVQEAGGTLSSFAGEPADPRSGELLASNGALHGAALELLRELREARDAG